MLDAYRFSRLYRLPRPCFIILAGLSSGRLIVVTCVLRLPSLYRRLGASITLCLFASAALAENQIDTPGVPGSALLQMLLGLAAIIGVLFAGAYLLRKLNGGRPFGNTGPLRMVGGLMLGPRERIVLIEIEDTWIVVGVVPGQIKTLYSQPKGELPVPANSERAFGQWLKQVAERNDGKN